MSIETTIFLFSGIVVLVLILANVILIVYLSRTNKKIDKLLGGAKIKGLKDIFLSQKEKNGELERQIKEAFLKIEDLAEISEKTIRKIGVVRFNPFSDLGGNQSFVIAMLDNRNNGFLISSLFVKDGNRVYAKAVKEGKSEHPLSDEEKQALERAIACKN